MSILNDVNVQHPKTVTQREGTRNKILKAFRCPQCGLTFDRASQLDYHHRSLHLGERSQICQICGKGFFRKADLRTHLNIHLGTNVCVCEICGRKFNHISNLIRHCRMHAGVKPYLCSICDKRFTQISSLARHKRIIHGSPKETISQYSYPSLINNKSQSSDYALKENNKMTIDNNVEHIHHTRICIEKKCEDVIKGPHVQKNKVTFNEDYINVDNKMVIPCLPLETAMYTGSKEVEENNLVRKESIDRLSQDNPARLKEKFGSTDKLMNKTIVLNSSRDIINNHEQIQSKDNIIYIHQFDKNSFTFLSQNRRLNAKIETENDKNILRLNSSGADISQNCREIFSEHNERLDTHLNRRNLDEISANRKGLHKQICKEVVNESKKCNKPINDDISQLYIELSDSGMLKFDESRCYNNIDLTTINSNFGMKSQHSTSETIDDIIYGAATTVNQNYLLHNEENSDNLHNSNNTILNNEESILRLVQTETGRQFYEFIISNLVEKMQNIPYIKNLENKVEESLPNSFKSCDKIEPNSKENNQKNQIVHQQALEDLTDINNEFNYTQFDFHREKSFPVLSHNESECFQQNSKDNKCTNNMHEKSAEAYNSENLELLENESHVDFDKYVETNLEAFERLNYENCNEKFLEFVEVADIAIEPTGSKEPSMVCLIQNDGEQLLELLRDSHIIEQESTNQDFAQENNLSKNCSNMMQNNNRITNFTENKSDFSMYIKDNVSLQENVSDNRDTKSNENCTYNSKHLHTNLIDNENATTENCVKVAAETKKPPLKKFQCSVCKKAFSTAYNYKQHIGVHFADRQRFHCKECGISFAWKSTLNKHIASNHNLNGPQKFVCEICPKVYSTLSQVNEHVKRDHLKQRNHICLHCGKSFFKRFDLKTHSRTHTNERPYVCRACGKRFHHQSHVIRHERTHSGER